MILQNYTHCANSAHYAKIIGTNTLYLKRHELCIHILIEKRHIASHH